VRAKAGGNDGPLSAACRHHATACRVIRTGAGKRRVDAYLAAWVASLDESDRDAIGSTPDDVIWIPCL